LITYTSRKPVSTDALNHIFLYLIDELRAMMKTEVVQG